MPLNHSVTEEKQNQLLQETPELKLLSIALLQSALISVSAALLDGALLYLFTSYAVALLPAIFVAKLAAFFTKLFFFKRKKISLNELLYRNNTKLFLGISLAVVFASTALIFTAVQYLGISLIQSFVLVGLFFFVVVNSLGILFSKILKIIGKSGISSFSASLCDFAVFNVVIFLRGTDAYLLANALSKFTGATINFNLQKYFAFNKRDGIYILQYLKYLAVSALSFGFNTLIIHLLTSRFGIDPRLAWPIAGFTVWLCWNFVMTRLLVFGLNPLRDKEMGK